MRGIQSDGCASSTVVAHRREAGAHKGKYRISMREHKVYEVSQVREVANLRRAIAPSTLFKPALEKHGEN